MIGIFRSVCVIVCIGAMAELKVNAEMITAKKPSFPL